MNILHMKYAVEVARLGSLNKAAETLMIAQPNISRSIKELLENEYKLGIIRCADSYDKYYKDNFIEGMACIGGCIGGADCLTHGEKNKAEVDKYGREALEKNISDAISILK